MFRYLTANPIILNTLASKSTAQLIAILSNQFAIAVFNYVYPKNHSSQLWSAYVLDLSARLCKRREWTVS